MSKSATKIAVLYSLFAGLSTVVNIGSQILSMFIYTDVMRYLGGVLGLSIGYYIKYQLDKPFVFVDISTKAVVV